MAVWEDYVQCVFRPVKVEGNTHSYVLHQQLLQENLIMGRRVFVKQGRDENLIINFP